MTAARRIPAVGGLAGGVGTTTVARALRGHDLGVVAGSDLLPDVLLCRDTAAGLAAAARVAPGAGRGGGPVLAVHPVSAEPDGVDSGAAGEGWAAVVALPLVPGWARAIDPWSDAATVLCRSTTSAPVRHYTEALRRVVTVLSDGTRLDRPLVGRYPGPLRPLRGVVLRPGRGR